MCAARSFDSSGKDYNAHDAKEFDITTRRADVLLFTRPVNENLTDSREYHHWAIVFVFEGDDVRTMEGFPDKSNKLYPKYTKKYPEEKGTYYELGKIVTSPPAVLEKCRNNSYNEKTYIATWQNCQSWVKELAYQIGGEIAKNIDNFHTLRQADPVVAVAGKKSTAVFGSFSR